MSFLKHILLVEDNLPDVELTLAALDQCHLANEIVSVRDGVEALDYLFCRGKFSHRPDESPVVILLDNSMPRMNGLEFLSKIKSDPRLKTIPVVMLTSSSDEPALAQAYKSGLDSYVVKPVDPKEFMAIIKQIGVFWAVLNEPLRTPANVL
jgi:CheY-like chemotaxis protein